jgi:oligopeptide/dipeptide ABC transporter ATP-binding protein
MKYGKMGKSETKRKITEILEKVKIPDASEKLNKYPHQLSGGMRQRVVIAMAISRQPKILLADEPTTSLDVTTQAQVLRLINDLTDKASSSLVLISHDMGVIAETCSRIAVMYAGRVMEYGDIRDVFREPLHPYTRALLNSIPQIDVDIVRLEAIPGKVPDLIDPPPGCRFHPRCKYARENCAKEVPDLKEMKERHYIACFGGE